MATVIPDKNAPGVDEKPPGCCEKNCGPDTMAFKIRVTIQQIVMSIFTLCALIFILVCIIGGKAALPGNPAVLVIVFFLGVYLLALNEGLQIAILQGNKLKLSPALRFLPSFHEAARCLELVEGDKLQWWLAGRQFFVICSVFVVAQVTTFNTMNHWPWSEQFWNPPPANLTGYNSTLITTTTLPPAEEGGIPAWFKVGILQTGVLGALVVVIAGQLVPQLVAVPCPILFFSLPGSYLILKIGMFFHTIGITYIAFLLTLMVRCCLKPKIGVHTSPNTTCCNIMDPIRYILSTIVFIFSVFMLCYGISKEHAALPGPWWLHTIIMLTMMVALAYLEGLQVALIDAKKCVEKLSPCARATFDLTSNDEAMGRFLCGRQVLVIFSVYLASQVTAFDELKYWPGMAETDANLIPEWLYASTIKTGLPATIVVCALSQLLPQLLAVSHPQNVLRMPAAIVCVGGALVIEYAGLARAASQITWFIRKCMPENFMVPFNKEMEELLHAMYTETQMAGPTREFGSGTRVTFDGETGEGTIEWGTFAAGEKENDKIEGDVEANPVAAIAAPRPGQTTTWQTK